MSLTDLEMDRIVCWMHPLTFDGALSGGEKPNMSRGGKKPNMSHGGKQISIPYNGPDAPCSP